MSSPASFRDLGLPARLTDVLTGLGIDVPTAIQAATLPDALAGRDVLGRGRTGSGKTYAFLLPLTARLSSGPTARARAPRALVLAPTRELVGQIEASLAPLARACRLSYVTVYGGVGQGPQVSALRRGVDIVLACPGRLEDLIAQQHCTLDDVEITILDEADHMADLGFLPAVRRLLEQTPRRGQRLLFSATLDKAVDTLVRQFLISPVTHEADSADSPVAAVAHHILHIEREHRLPILLDLTSAPGRTVVFTRTKRGAKTLAQQLNRGGVPAVDLHGDLAQSARSRNLDAFHTGTATVLVATDIAARGIHVEDVTLVVHADPPAEHKAYLHRSGRTARAGKGGTVVTLATGEQLRDVRALARTASISATTTRISGSTHPILGELVPGRRRLIEPVRHHDGGSKRTSAPASHPAGQATRSRRGRPGRTGARHTTDGPDPKTASKTMTSGGSPEESHPRRAGARHHPAARRSRNAPGPRHSAAAFSSGRR